MAVGGVRELREPRAVLLARKEGDWDTIEKNLLKGDPERRAILAYQVAETYLRVNQLDQARERFKKVILINSFSIMQCCNNCSFIH